MLNYRSIGIKLGEGLKSDIPVMEISRKASKIFKFAISLHPDDSVTTPASQMIYDWVKSLSEHSVDEEEKRGLLQQFIDSLTPDDSPLRNLLNETEELPDEDFWKYINEKVTEISRGKFEHGYCLDAATSAFQAITKMIRDIVQERTGEKLMGEALMEKAFCGDEPIIVIDNISSREGKILQKSFCQIFSGVFSGIDKPGTTATKKDVVHLLFFASMMMSKLDNAKH